MKRDSRLIAFSREHHLALKLGNQLAKIDCAEKGNSEIAANRAMLLTHFSEEEDDLLEIIKKLDNDAVRERFLKDHQQLRALLTKGQLSLQELQQFGTQLIAHTRFEERELFALIQEYWEKVD